MRKKRSRSPARRSASQAAASFIRRYSASRRASSSAASSGSSSASSASSSGKSAAGLQLEQRGDQNEELAAGLEIELVPLGEALDEGDHDRRHVDLGRLELLFQEQREQQVEGALERVEVQLEFAHNHVAAGG